MRCPVAAWSAFAATAVVAVACGDASGPPVQPPALHSEAIATAYTTRLPGHDPEQLSISVSQTVYAATREENAAGAIILCRQDPALAFTAMHRITHMPVNAPLLYLTHGGALSDATLREMRRIRPDGVLQDGKVQVYVVGRVSDAVLAQVRDELGYRVRSFAEDDPIALAELLDRWQAAVKADHPDEVVVSALGREGIAHGLGAMGWNAHMGKGFAWVLRDSVPEPTRQILQRRFESGDYEGAYIYVTGGEEIVSDDVVRELAAFGLVRRIAGVDEYATNAVNAGYKDFGRNFGWWWGWTPRSFGWGLAQAGHNFIFANADDLLGAIPSVLLGHMGKHGPLLLVQHDRVPQSVADYLAMVRPFPSGPRQTIRNHGWILGGRERISWSTQAELHRLLAPSDGESTGETEQSQHVGKQK